jgi:hypothetical protein
MLSNFHLKCSTAHDILFLEKYDIAAESVLLLSINLSSVACHINILIQAIFNIELFHLAYLYNILTL